MKISISTHYRLAVSVRHEVWHLLLQRIHTCRAAALGQSMLPHVLGVRVVAAVTAVTVVSGWVEAAVGRRLGISAAILRSLLRKPLVVSGIA